jgi:hypothetical protein
MEGHEMKKKTRMKIRMKMGTKRTKTMVEYKARRSLILRNYPQNFWSGHRPSLAG